MHLFLKFIFGIELYIFRTGFLSIFRILVLYTQQYLLMCHTGYADSLLWESGCYRKPDRKPVRKI